MPACVRLWWLGGLIALGLASGLGRLIPGRSLFLFSCQAAVLLPLPLPFLLLLPATYLLRLTDLRLLLFLPLPTAAKASARAPKTYQVVRQ